MALIKAENLTKKYGNKSVIENLSFSVEKGEFFHILGENGSGKTTLMRLILGLIEADSGSIEYSDISKTEIGYLPQQSGIEPDFPASAAEVVLSGFLNRKGLLFYSAEQRKKARDIMRRLNVLELYHKPFSSLSGGQRQRVLLSRALCATGGVLMLDEPLAGLDPIAAAGFFEVLDTLKKQNYTVIMISHDIHCAVKYADKILHLTGGGAFFGTPHEYAHSPEGEKMFKEGHHHHD